MTTNGFIDIYLPGMRITGTFINGKLHNGMMQFNDIVYTGTFNEETLLHGANCSMTVGDVTYQGVFNDGELVVGMTIFDGNVVEKGRYTFVGTTKKPHLIDGIKSIGKITYEGKFDNYGELITGVQSDGKHKLEGYFNNGQLIKGTETVTIKRTKTSHDVKHNNTSYDVKHNDTSHDVNYNDTFVCSYKKSYNSDYGCELLDTCDVKWNGTIEQLPKSLLVLLCCQGVNSTWAHVFYNQYLHLFDSTAIRYIHKTMFAQLTPLEEAGLSIILTNLKKYPDYVLLYDHTNLNNTEHHLYRSKSNPLHV